MNTKPLLATLALAAGMLGLPCAAQDLPFSRHVFAVAPFVLDSAKKVPANPVAGQTGSVLIVFRTSEQGAVIDMRSTGGTPELQKSAETALSQWHFSPFVDASGQPQEGFSALLFDFSTDPPTPSTPKPMSAAQLAPTISFQCGKALAIQSQDAVDFCKKQADSILKSSSSSAMERFTAYDEYGLALLISGKKRDLALEQFNKAIELALTGLKPSDAEWAYVYWHRGVAESATGDAAQANHDFQLAVESLRHAETAIGPPADAYYRGLESKVSSLLQAK